MCLSVLIDVIVIIAGWGEWSLNNHGEVETDADDQTTDIKNKIPV